MGPDTKVRVSRSKLRELENLRNQFSMRSLDKTIVALIRKYRIEALREVFGADRGRVKPFTEADRGEGPTDRCVSA